MKRLLLSGMLCCATAMHARSNGLLFYLSGDKSTTAEISAGGTPQPTYDAHVKPISDGARNGGLECGDYQLLAYRAPGNVYAQRGTVAFFWRSRYPVGPTEFPIFRIGYADHSSWDMVFLRLDYNGRGFDAFVTDASLARTRVSVHLPALADPKSWTHLALAWDEATGVRLYVNGKLAAERARVARYDAALDQFGPHSRVISPYQVQSDYNFVRGGDIDELRIYDHMLAPEVVRTLAQVRAPNEVSTDRPESDAARPYPRALSRPQERAAWYYRHGWAEAAPPELPPGANIAIRKVEVHDAYDLKRWWWKANDGIRETTWPGVYNRSRLPGRHDYFELPDWDCYVESGRAITFALPDEPCNHLEIAGSASGSMELLPATVTLPTAYLAPADERLFQREQGRERTSHRLPSPIRGHRIRFNNAQPEEPIGELGAYLITAGNEPTGSRQLGFKLCPSGSNTGIAELGPIETFIDGRYPSDERSRLVARDADTPLPLLDYAASPALPIVHVLIPNRWDGFPDGLDGIAVDIPALRLPATHGAFVAVNLSVKDPLWPLRSMLDVNVSIKPGEAKTLWLDLRDRLLPVGKPLWLTIACSSPAFDERTLSGANVRLVFKPRAEARPEHELDRFTQIRDVYAMMVEERPANPRLDLWNRFKGDLDDLLRVNPDHYLGLQYAAAGVRGAAKLPFTQPAPTDGTPLWAFRQVKLLGYAKRFVLWYVAHRQVPYGDFGGGISDDSDLLNTWPGVALMGAAPEEIRASVEGLLDAAYRNGMFTRGLSTIQTDELHSYEEGINAIGQSLLLAHGSPRQIERAMETARGVESITGINRAGHRHIRTSYYSGTKMAEEDPWGFAKPYSYLVLQVPQLLVEFNGHPATKRYLLELADGLLAHYRPQSGRSGPRVPAIRFADDSEHDVGRGAFPWHVFWTAHVFTGDRKYLAPILDGGVTSLALVNPNVLDLLDLRAEAGARLEAGEQPVAVGGRRDPDPARPQTNNFRTSNSGHFAWQLSGDKTHLEQLYAAQIETCASLEYINTEGSLWSDRVGVPTAELQRARLGGVALVRNGVFPGHAISWRFSRWGDEERVALLVPSATRTELKIVAYNLADSPISATLTGWNVDPGDWTMTEGIDADGDDQPERTTAVRTVPFGRSKSVELTFAPRTTSVIHLKRVRAGTPYWELPDAGIDRQDVVVDGRAVRVTVHSLGSVPMPPTVVAVRSADQRVLASTVTAPIEAPLDLLPKTITITLEIPDAASLEGGTIELDPNEEHEEITRLNNVVRW